MTERPRAVVLGRMHPRSIAAIRSLGRAGIRVIYADHMRWFCGSGSKYVDEELRLSPDPKTAVGMLCALGEEWPGVLLPTDDYYLELVARHFHVLSGHFRIATVSWQQLEVHLDRPRCYAVARSVDIRTPTTFAPQSEAELDDVLATLAPEGTAYVLKTPVSSVPADPTTGRFSRVADSDLSALRATCIEIAGRAGQLPVIEEVIPGHADACVGVSMVVGADHRPLFAYCIRRLRLYTYSSSGQFQHPYEVGANVFCELTRDDEAVAAATRFVHAIEYFGAITVEFKRDTRTDELVFIKSDPRLVRATALGEHAGVDVPKALYDACVGTAATTVVDPDARGAWVWIYWYLRALWVNRGNRPVAAELLRLLVKRRGVRAYAYWSLDDPLPFVVSLLRMSSTLRRLGGTLILRWFRNRMEKHSEQTIARLGRMSREN